MHGNHLYEYAVIRFLSKVEREEFINVGIIVMCKKAGFLKMKYLVDNQKIGCFSHNVDISALLAYLRSMEKICEGKVDGGAMAQEDVAARFRWLCAVRSASIQTSRPHPGFSFNLENTLNRLFEEMVV